MLIKRTPERALERCRRAHDRRRRVRGRVARAGAEGLLVELGGVFGHVPPGDAAVPRREAGAMGAHAHPGSAWSGWVVAIGAHLVFLTSSPLGAPDPRPVRRARVVAVGRDGARVELEPAGAGQASRHAGSADRAVVPFTELSWFDALVPPAIAVGETITGRITDLDVDGPVVSPRAVTPSPWPAIALALPPGARAAATLQATAGDRAQVLLDAPGRPVIVLPGESLPVGARPGDELEVTIARVDAAAERIVVDAVSARRGAPRAQAAAREEPRAPGPGAGGSRS